MSNTAYALFRLIYSPDVLDGRDDVVFLQRCLAVILLSGDYND